MADNNKEFKFKRSTPQISDVHHGEINTTNWGQNVKKEHPRE
tara:strand:- start:477 stop:602 length:126 start_codon:yes stop_codon:yes gene_type:complete